MSGSIRKSIVICAAVILTLFVFVSFAVSYTCVRYTGNKYRESVADSALDYAETVIDADLAHDLRRKLSRFTDPVFFPGDNDILIDNVSGCAP